MGLCSAIAISIDPSGLDPMRSYGFGYGASALYELLAAELKRPGLAETALAICAVALYVKELLCVKRPFHPTACAVSCLFALFLVSGDSLTTFFDFTFVTFCRPQALIAATVFLGYWAIMYFPLVYLFNWLDGFALSPGRGAVVMRLPAWFTARFGTCCACAMLAFWLLMLVALWPGSVPFDGRYQLNMFFGLTQMDLHHPYWSTLLLGSLYGIGNALAGPNGGAFSVVLFQAISAAAVFSMICSYVRDNAGTPLALVSLAFYAFAPMWWAYIQTVMKDTLYFTAFALYSLMYIKVLRNDAGVQSIVALAVSAVLVCLLRNNGIYIIALSLVALAVQAVVRKDRPRRVLGALGIVCAAHALLNIAVPAVLQLDPASQVEAISVPLQQVARYTSQYGDELSTDDIQVIDHIVVAADIADRYDPVYADPVKDWHRSDISRQDFRSFFELYVRLFSTHPLPYIEAAADHAFGYLDPRYQYHGLSTYQLYQMTPIGDEDAEVDYAVYAFPDDVRVTFKGLTAYIWEQVPILSAVVSPATYTWIVIVVFAQLLRRRRIADMCMLVAPCMNILICFVSPVNGLLRYALPIMAAVPLYFVSCAPRLREGAEAATINHTTPALKDV